MKKSLLGVLLIVVVIVAAAVGFYYTSRPQPGVTTPGVTTPGVTTPGVTTAGVAEQVLRIADNTPSATSSFDPAQNFETPDPIYNMYDRLVMFNATDYTRVLPMVAESWDISPDGTVYTFHLRSGVKFTGTTDEVDASAVKFSIERVQELNGPPAWMLRPDGGVMKITSIEAVDPHTVRFTLAVPSASFLSLMANTISAIVDPKIIAAHQSGTDLASPWLSDHSAGSGPFSLDHWTRGQELVLIPNKQYWRGSPKLDKIIWTNVIEGTTKIFGLQRGDIDVTGGMHGALSPDQLALVKMIKGVRLVSLGYLWTEYMGMDLGAKLKLTNGTVAQPFMDRRVRNAFRLALNYTAIVDTLGGGSAERLGGPIPNGLLGYDPSLIIKQDVPRAQQLMKESGFGDGFTVTCLTVAGPSSIGVPYTDFALQMRSDLSALNVNLQIQVVEEATWYRIYRAGQAEMVIGGWTADFADPDTFTYPFMGTGGSATHRLHYENSTINDLIIKATAEVDPVKRAQLLVEAQRLLNDDGPWAFLFQPVVVTVLGPLVNPVSAFQSIWGNEYYLVYKTSASSAGIIGPAIFSMPVRDWLRRNGRLPASF